MIPHCARRTLRPPRWASGWGNFKNSRQLHGSAVARAKVVCVLFDDPVTGYPPQYLRDGIPDVARYADGQPMPRPFSKADLGPGMLLGSVSGELGLRSFVEGRGHELIVTSSKDGPDSDLDRHLPETEVVISQPFWPAYMTADRIARAPKLKLCVTAGVGSDHIDLAAACAHNITVAEVTQSNSTSVAEHVVMMTLALVRNFLPSCGWVVRGGWNIADCTSHAYDIEGMHVGSVGAGRIGLAVLKRMKPFDVHLHYTDRHRLPEDVESGLGLTYHADVESMVKACDVVTINCPLHPGTEHMFNEELIYKMKRGAFLVNTARGKICDQGAVARAIEELQLAGYAGDVWFPEPPSWDHPWRCMPRQAMTPHVAGATLAAQFRYAEGVREILERHFDQRPIRPEYIVAEDGKLSGVGAHSYDLGNTTEGSAAAGHSDAGTWRGF